MTASPRPASSRMRPTSRMVAGVAREDPPNFSTFIGVGNGGYGGNRDHREERRSRGERRTKIFFSARLCFSVPPVIAVPSVIAVVSLDGDRDVGVGPAALEAAAARAGAVVALDAQDVVTRLAE